ncbi:MAG TPA: hypothetical protein VGC92_00420, partial [Phenylobacterium sp.]
LAGLLLVAGAVCQLAGPHTKVNELTLNLIYANKRVPLDVAAVCLNALGLAALALTLLFLFGAARGRNAQTQPFVPAFALVGGIGGAIMGVINEVLIATKSHQFVTTGTQTYPQANHLTSGTAFQIVPLLGLICALLLAVALVLSSLAAMRVGLLTRFMGYLGMFAGALVLFQITQVPVVQAYWLFALAYLFSGRWPTGVPPAWRSGRAEKWPTSQEMREQRVRAAGARGAGRGAPAPQTVGASAPNGSSKSAPASAARSAGAKRKRKRRK